MDFSQLFAMAGGSVYILFFFIVALSVIVAIHEYGHYIVGRWCGISADVFSVGFGKVLWSRVDKRGTRWQIAAIPFGGYVKFAGDANAASVGGNVDVEPARHTMLGAPLWARSLTVLAGPVANFILAIFVFAGYLMYQGMPTEDIIVKSSIDMPPGFESELQPGDQILQVDSVVFGDPDTGNVDDLPKSQTRTYTVIRKHMEIEVEGPNLIIPRVTSLIPRSAADDAKLRVDDVITAIDGENIYAFNEIIAAVTQAEGTPLTLTVWRAGDVFEVELSPRRVDNPLPEGGFETRWLIGIGGDVFFETETESVGAGEALLLGVDRLWYLIKTSLSGLVHVFSGDISTCNISGPVAIAQASGSMASQGTSSFVLFIGMISAAVGLFNLFPIPILDGGHLVFHAYEGITGRKPNDKALQFLMIIGLSLLGALMVFAFLNDLVLCP